MTPILGLDNENFNSHGLGAWTQVGDTGHRGVITNRLQVWERHVVGGGALHSRETLGSVEENAAPGGTMGGTRRVCDEKSSGTQTQLVSLVAGGTTRWCNPQ